ncbi:MAG: peptidoglycan DD-metalloendopeptidase family protein [Aestuariivirga sp.]|uniref:murein hydrolase activator EnvC family protein n=1 Tax=Aestuariivirga sp. TaxID=2650926 RepID=UPI0025C46B72|nr:peptidoglycan DD-metalloendopeptidase family protein [Aestuariivirga sp.]MCA3560118.1 peptidoglycan DD-metalloendopeptidase family protein [Aestuariivirga sp.]
MRHLATSTALLALALMFRGGPAHAQEQQQLDTLSQQIESGKANEARIAGEIAAAVQAQEAIAAKLSAIARSIQSQENAVAQSERGLAKLRQDRAEILTALGEKQDVLSELLAGLQRLEQNPPPALVVDPGDILSALRGAMLLGTIAPELQDEAKALAAKLDQLKALEATIATRKEDVSREIARLNGERAALKDLVTQKKALVSQGTAELEAERQRMAELAEKAKSLKQLLANLEAQRQQQEAAKAAEQRQRESQEALLRQPRLAFPDARGKLAFPAQGSIVRRFGEPDGLGRDTQGLMIATSANAQVTAPADGKVEFAGPFRSYGKVVILNPGGGYRLLLAGMDKVTAGVGEFLRAGEPVGEMGSGPASVTLFGDVVPDGRPVLYIEFRDGTEAIDSGPWWIGGLKEASG